MNLDDYKLAPLIHLYDCCVIQIDSFTKQEQLQENHPNGYSKCAGCHKTYHNEHVMVVEEPGLHICLVCAYNIVRLYLNR